VVVDVEGSSEHLFIMLGLAFSLLLWTLTGLGNQSYTFRLPEYNTLLPTVAGCTPTHNQTMLI
jgi:hypothetical protein